MFLLALLLAVGESSPPPPPFARRPPPAPRPVVSTAGACLGGACTYGSAEEDCLIAGDRCVGGACETPADLCATLTCPALAPACDGNSVVTTTGAGTCDNAFPGCDYSAVSVTTPCTGAETCFEGACVRGPLPGDLVLSEIFYDGSGSDVAQEWFEFVNVSAASLNIVFRIVT